MRHQLKKRTRVLAVEVLAGTALVGTVGYTSKMNASSTPPGCGGRGGATERYSIEHEWIGTLDGMVNAAVKAQVTDNLLTQNYAEGS